MRALEKLNAATHVSAEAVQYELAQINAILEEQRADQERLNNAIQKYGFTMEEAGAVWRQQQMHSQAKELIEDWRVLVGSGIDFALVNERMAEAINEYFHMALRTGAEIPAAFEPILQKMVETGDLTGLNGEKITDLNAVTINWARTMGQEFDRVIEKLEQLFQKVFGVGDAINNIPREVVIDVIFRTPTEDAEYTGGKAVPRNLNPATEVGVLDGLPGFARGTQGQFVDFGAGTPVMLHGRERVVTDEEQRETGSGGLTLQFNTEINALDASGVDAAVMDKLAAKVVRTVLRYNPENSRDNLRRGMNE